MKCTDAARHKVKYKKQRAQRTTKTQTTTWSPRRGLQVEGRGSRVVYLQRRKNDNNKKERSRDALKREAVIITARRRLNT